MVREHTGHLEGRESAHTTKRYSDHHGNGGHGHERLFNALKPEILEAFRESQVTHSYPPGFPVFQAGETSKGIYLIHAGKVRLSISAHGKEGVNSRIARRGEILGLTTTVSGRPYEVTAETLCTSQLSFIPKHVVIKFMDQDADFAFRVLHFLCQDLHSAFEHVRSHVRPPRRNHRN